MNTDLIERVAKRIDEAEFCSGYLGGNPDRVEYCQKEFVYACGTPACVAGHVLAEAGYDFSEFQEGGRRVILDPDGVRVDTAEAARKELGIPSHAASDLFAMHPLGVRCPTPADAAACLRRLAETGEVQWTERCVFVDGFCTVCYRHTYLPVPAFKLPGEMEESETHPAADPGEILGGRARDFADAAWHHAEALGFQIGCCETAYDRAYKAVDPGGLPVDPAPQRQGS